MVGKLRKNDNGRWEVANDQGERVELTSGDVVELLNGTEWVTTRIESQSSNTPPFTAEYLRWTGVRYIRARWLDILGVSELRLIPIPQL